MITSAEMAVVDENAAALGVPRKQLMESSGNAVARVVREVVTDGTGAADDESGTGAVDGDRSGGGTAPAEVALVCGRGNNGGDAFVAARFLDDLDVTVHLLGRRESISTEIARENWAALRRADLDVREVTDAAALDLGDPDVVVDAMLGTGVRGALREPEATAAAAIGETGATVVSVDVPSGVDADTGEHEGASVDADHVVTFHDAKPGLSSLEASVTVADIGIPAAAELFVERGDLRRLSRDAGAHKGDAGRVLVVGGGPYAGAPALAARAALRAGADLAFVACPASVVDEVQGYSEDLITRSLPGDRVDTGHVDRLLELAGGMDAVVLGPGLGDHEGSLEAAADLLARYQGVAVVDADPLQVVPDVETDATLVCTPHQGELRGMGGETDDDWRERAELVAAFADDLGHTVLVKGAHDVITDGETTRVNRTGNPGMTVGGTGDVLAGVTGALACVLDPVEAGAVAAYANGRAGDAVVGERGHGLTATDLVEEVPGALWPDGA